VTKTQKKKHLLFMNMLLILSVLTVFAYLDITHQKAAETAIDLVQRSDRGRGPSIYQEIYYPAYKKALITGAGGHLYGEDYGHVDGNERCFRHYYDPDTKKGVGWYTYFYIWRGEGGKVEKPANGTHYENALEWARNSAGLADVRNWEGAIKAYDYTEASRIEAFYRLGTVVHLITDMAQPDHATCTPHAGSSFVWPDDLKKAQMFINGSSLPNLFKKRLVNSLLEYMKTYTKDEGKKVGFEKLIEDFFVQNPGFSIPDPKNKSYARRLDDYFDDMAEESKKAMGNSDSLYGKKMTYPLGLVYHPSPNWIEESAWNNLGMQNYSFFPNIPQNNEDEKNAYIKLAVDLLSYSSELNSALLKQFNDIVRQPSYVKKVTVSQKGLPKYRASWKDIKRSEAGSHTVSAEAKKDKPYNYDVIIRREWNPELNLLLEPDEPAVVEIEFGPNEAFSPVQIDSVNLKIEGHLYSSSGTWKKSKNNSQIFQETFTPMPSESGKLTYKMTISARDIFKKVLDKDPRTPAKAHFKHPYPINNYEKGEDTWHEIQIEPEEKETIKTENEEDEKDEEKGEGQEDGTEEREEDSENDEGAHLLWSLSIDPPSAELVVGQKESVSVTAVIIDVEGKIVPADRLTDINYEWYVNDPSIAGITGYGKTVSVYAIKEGEVLAICSTSNFVATATIIIKRGKSGGFRADEGGETEEGGGGGGEGEEEGGGFESGGGRTEEGGGGSGGEEEGGGFQADEGGETGEGGPPRDEAAVDPGCESLEARFISALQLGDYNWAQELLDKGRVLNQGRGCDFNSWGEDALQMAIQQDQCRDLYNRFYAEMIRPNPNLGTAKSILAEAQGMQCDFCAEASQWLSQTQHFQSCQSLIGQIQTAIQTNNLNAAVSLIKQAQSYNCPVPGELYQQLNQAVRNQELLQRQQQQQRHQEWEQQRERNRQNVLQLLEVINNNLINNIKNIRRNRTNQAPTTNIPGISLPPLPGDKFNIPQMVHGLVPAQGYTRSGQVDSSGSSQQQEWSGRCLVLVDQYHGDIQKWTNLNPISTCYGDGKPAYETSCSNCGHKGDYVLEKYWDRCLKKYRCWMYDFEK
jgi:hypothetical protein